MNGKKRGVRMERKDEPRPAILEVQKLSKHFEIGKGLLGGQKQILKAVDNVDLTVYEGETLGIVGESGCGKSTLGNMIMQLTDITSGRICFEKTDLSGLSKKAMRQRRKDIQMIFQDPFSSLNPRLKVFDIIAEPLRTHKIAEGKQLTEQVHALLEAVGLPPEYADRYPHQFSGGQRQRIGIGRALALRPKLIVCDEPVSALDVSIQSQILNLLSGLQKQYGLTYIFIAHGIPAVSYISDRIAVMYFGRIVEIADMKDLIERPAHPYTEGLLASVPITNPEFRGRKRVLEGETPNPFDPPSGCSFHPRCPYAKERCTKELPPLEPKADGRTVACHYPLTLGGTTDA
jgi:peptide/nickel transport system ATP-binding protein